MDKKSGFYALCDKLALGALSVFTLECVLGSSGRWLSFGSISIRMVLFAVCFLLTLPNVCRKYKELLKTPHIIVTVLLGAILVLAAIIGWRRGNSLSFIKADITGYMAFALLPGFLATIHNRERVTRISNLIFYGALALAAFSVFLHFYCALAESKHIIKINNWVNKHAMGGMATMTTGVQRIYFRSHMFLQVGLLLGLQKIWLHKGKIRWLLLGAEAILAFACLMTYTRGFWLGFALSALFLLILYPKQWKRYLTTMGCTAALLVVLLLFSWLSFGKPTAAIEIVNRFNPNLIGGAVFLPDNSDTTSTTAPAPTAKPNETEAETEAGTEVITAPTETEAVTGPTETEAVTEPPETPTTREDKIKAQVEKSNMNSLKVRQDSLRLLGKRIGDKPLFGNGLGANLDEIRDDGKVEYMYFDVLMKIGFVGFVLFCAAFFLPAFGLLKHRIREMIRRKEIHWGSLEMHNLILLTAFLGVAITSYLNPFLLNPMGILLVMLLSAANRCENKK